MSKVPRLSEALTDQEWRDIKERGLKWHLDGQRKVVLETPNGKRRSIGRSLKQAYAAL